MTNDRSLIFVASHRRPRRGPIRSLAYAAGRIRSSIGLGFTVERPAFRLGRQDEAR